ncbi:chloride intracellular channel exl-1-like [Uloborus diversus]|uniref:chloride intracellular channel exl-1-like n=1 Tax=Uloborus diversus TaxID=327109 RepID=UPI002408FAD3|nr:chloride intracellular channel exl-1-like [Uloborus diversus]XP_054723152.1 chloride intracellular channel exl-1-like [Uloborus diversus]
MSSMPEVLLFVKAGHDGKKYGACPFCHRIFMILLLKSGQEQLQFKVATVNLAKPPSVFHKLTLRRVPALVHGDTSLDNIDEVIQYLDDTFPTNQLQYDNADADMYCADVFQKFCFYVKDVSKDASQLEAELGKIDSYLQTCKTKYLCGDHLTHLDCEILPKLHQIRIAAKALKGFDIPAQFKNLFTYLNNAYKNDVFVKSCPSDQEIIIHWADKPETPNLSMEERAKLTREEPQFSLVC